MKNKLIDYYDETKWGEKILSKDELFDRELKSLDLIESLNLKKDARFLDIGCGIGFFMEKLHKQNPKLDLYGVDYSEYNIKLAKKLNFKFEKCNIEDGLPYKDKFFDIVYAAELIEHITNPDYLLEECYRILKPGGFIIITTPNLAAWYNRFLLLFGMQPMFYEFSTKSPKIGSGVLGNIKQGTIPVGHIRIFTINAMKDLLKNEGFETRDIKGTHFTALPRPIRIIDNFFRSYPKLSSGMIVMASKIKDTNK